MLRGPKDQLLFVVCLFAISALCLVSFFIGTQYPNHPAPTFKIGDVISIYGSVTNPGGELMTTAFVSDIKIESRPVYELKLPDGTKTSGQEHPAPAYLIARKIGH